jgi:hypothetical protein
MPRRPVAANAAWFEQVHATRLTLLGVVGVMIAAALSHDLAAGAAPLKATPVQSIEPSSPGS